jgi:uncharacterized protein
MDMDLAATPPEQVLLIHVYSDVLDVVASALRVAQNAIATLPPDATVRIVVQGGAVRALVSHSGEHEQVMARESRIQVVACSNSLRGARIDPGEVSAGVTVVPAAVSHIAEQQWAGAAYMRL